MDEAEGDEAGTDDVTMTKYALKTNYKSVLLYSIELSETSIR